MPLYQYRNENTGEEEEHFVKMADAQQFLLDNPHLKRMVCAPALADPVLIGRTRPSDGFNSILKDIQKHHPHGQVNAR